VIGLGLAAILVIYAFDANLTKLIQMYVVGVFTSFTLSQTGMVLHWRAESRRGAEAFSGWRRSMVINAVGGFTTAVVLVVVTATKFLKGAWLSILVMICIIPLLRMVHRHYTTVAQQLARGVARAGEYGSNHVVLLVRTLDAATAEALGYVRSFRPRDLHIVYPTDGESVPAEVRDAWRAFAGDAPDLEPLHGKGDLLRQVRRYVRSIEPAPEDFVTVVVPEVVRGGLFAYVLRRRDLIHLKGRLLREPNVVVTDAPVAEHRGTPVSVDAKPLIPQHTVTLVFVSTVNDVTIRAVNYAQSIGAVETRAIYFDLDPEEAHALEERWFDARMGIPLDIVGAPFRDLSGPMLEEVRRYTDRSDTVVNVVIPEIVVRKRWQLILHNQNALFIKRLFLFEPRAVLTSVPFVLGSTAKPAVSRSTG
jgi:hypothetical protein